MKPFKHGSPVFSGTAPREHASQFMENDVPRCSSISVFSGHISYIILRYFEDCAQEKEIVPIIRRPQQTAGGARPRRNVVARSLAATVFWCCEQVAAGLANSKVWSSFLWISCGAYFLLDVLTCLGDRRKTYADVSKEEWSHEC